jgi:hypothetical protein
MRYVHCNSAHSKPKCPLNNSLKLRTGDSKIRPNPSSFKTIEFTNKREKKTLGTYIKYCNQYFFTKISLLGIVDHHQLELSVDCSFKICCILCFNNFLNKWVLLLNIIFKKAHKIKNLQYSYQSLINDCSNEF